MHILRIQHCRLLFISSPYDPDVRAQGGGGVFKINVELDMGGRGGQNVSFGPTSLMNDL